MDEELLKTLGDFTSRENWDKFFTIKGIHDPFEWYSEWPRLHVHLLDELRSLSSYAATGDSARDELTCRILVPGCGNSRLSECLYDAGFHNITNVDFSRVVISDMLRLHLRSRPNMRWRVMDMTDLQFADGSFDAVVDKGGLDALMEPEHGPELGKQYLSEVKRVLSSEGKYVCITLAESHVVELLFSMFRFGWKIDIQSITQEGSSNHGFRTFLLAITRAKSSTLDLIVPSLDCSVIDMGGSQVHGLLQAIEAENKIRSESMLDDPDIVYCLEDLDIRVKGDLEQIMPGRRFRLTLGSKKCSRFSYNAVVLDSKPASETPMYHCGVFLVPETRAHEWLFTSEEGQWLIVENAKASRLIMVFLDTQHRLAGMNDIQNDLSPLVKKLAPGKVDNSAQILFMMANDGVKHRTIVHQATSAMTGEIIVEDVVYEEDESIDEHTRPKDSTFRRLTFKRSLGLVQSEALLVVKHTTAMHEGGRKNKSSGSRAAKRSPPKGTRDRMVVDHSYLASSYHSTIIAGFSLIASDMNNLVISGRKIKTVIIGLGGGLLPMFLRRYISNLDLEVIELDPVVADLARDCFDFKEDSLMKVQICDGIQFLNEIAHAQAPEHIDGTNRMRFDPEGISNASSKHDSFYGHDAARWNGRKIDILIIDADAADLSTGLTCPPVNFTEESFLMAARESLSEFGLFIINMVSRSPSIREKIVHRMQNVFPHIFFLKIEEDVNEVLFALATDQRIKDNFLESTTQFQKLFNLSQPRILKFIETAKMIRRLK